jgi:RES domain
MTLKAGAQIVRIHRLGQGPHWFGPGPGQPPAYRFDAPNGEYRTLYAAQRLEGAFVETLLRRANRLLPLSQVDDRQWSVLEVERDLLLAKVFNQGLIRHNVTTDICAGDDYTASQTLALSLHAAYPDLDGIAYRARHDNGEICFALFDRVDAAQIPIADQREFAKEIRTRDRLLRRYGAAIDPMTVLPPP